MLAADDGKISRTGHRQPSLSRLQPTEPMRQPLPQPSAEPSRTSARAPRPAEPGGSPDRPPHLWT